MAGFLLGHAADLVAGSAVPYDRELAVIDPNGPIFAGMVDPDHPLDLGVGHRISRQVGRALCGHANPRGAPSATPRRRAPCSSAATQQPVMISEASRFHPASDTPNSVQAGRSHSTGAVPRICCFICSRVIAAPELAVQ